MIILLYNEFNTNKAIYIYIYNSKTNNKNNNNLEGKYYAFILQRNKYNRIVRTNVIGQDKYKNFFYNLKSIIIVGILKYNT